MRALPISRTARRRFGLEADAAPGPATVAGAATRGLAADIVAARRVVAAVNRTRRAGEPSAQAGELAAFDLLHEIFHLLVVKAAELVPDTSMTASTEAVEEVVGEPVLDDLLEAVADEFPDVDDRPAPVRLEELLLVRVANENPAARPLRDLVDDTPLPEEPRTATMTALEAYQGDLTPIGPNGETLIELLRAPARAHPTSIAGQLRYVRDQWRGLLGADLDALLDRVLVTLDVIAEEERGLHLRFGGGGDGGAGGRGESADLSGLEAEPERFSSDSAWMPRLVLIAKSTHVWLDQLSRRYGRDIRTLDAVPDEELDRLARWGITGLWLIGLWERSLASQRIKTWRGNPDAAASAYSLDDYRIADDLGGEGAWANLRQRAWARGVRLASDMVPNHMGIDSRWVIEHPDWFISLPEPPYPGYTFDGENLAEDERVEIRLEDHYWDNSDAAVVFERRDRQSGERRYVYHGNDGTSFPWNDTAQLDFTQAAVREQVIQTILDVARRFPVIRFDAAMVLAKKHVRRLWFPAPGEGGGAIPSRAEFGTMTQAEFDAAMPTEFWREVVDRVAVEAPDTLLLAEAFWLLEGYFVRTLGMHRVYNSAFMHMLRDEDNAGYRRVLKETLEFDPEILKRYVNFMNNPDEKTAVEQFGKGDKYFGVATLLATLPGPADVRATASSRASPRSTGWSSGGRRWTRQPDAWLIERHEREIVPLLHRRGDFAEARDFLLYDVASRRRRGRRARVRLLQRHRAGAVAGRVPQPLRRDRGLDPRFGRVRGQGGRRVEDGWCAGRWRTGLGLAEGPGRRRWLAMPRAAVVARVPALGRGDPGARPARHAARLRVAGVLGAPRAVRRGRGLAAAGRAARRRGVPSLEDALRDQQLAPVHDALRAVDRRAVAELAVERLVDAVADGHGDRAAIGPPSSSPSPSARPAPSRSIAAIAKPRRRRRSASGRCSRRSGRWRRARAIGTTSRAWFEELRLPPAVADALRGRGLDEGAAWWAAERVRTAARPAAAVDARRPGVHGAAAAGGRVAGRTRSSDRSCGSTPGTARVVPRRVVARAPRLDGSPGAGPDAARGAGPAPGGAVGAGADAARRGGRGVGLPRRRAARGAGFGRHAASPAAGRTSRLPKATGLPPGPKDAPSDAPKPASRKGGPPSGEAGPGR